MDTEDQNLRIVLLGTTGSGKSSTGNTICGGRVFTTNSTDGHPSFESIKETANINGQWLSIVDTPGFYYPNKSNLEVEREIAKGVALAAPGPHVLLVVIRSDRYTDHEQKAVKIIQRMFGEVRSCYTMVLFTHGDDLEANAMSIDDIVNQTPDLRAFIRKCGGGYHVFNNRDEDPSQVRELLGKINRMVQRRIYYAYYLRVDKWYLDGLATAIAIGGGVATVAAIAGVGAAAAVGAGAGAATGAAMASVGAGAGAIAGAAAGAAAATFVVVATAITTDLPKATTDSIGKEIWDNFNILGVRTIGGASVGLAALSIGKDIALAGVAAVFAGDFPSVVHSVIGVGAAAAAVVAGVTVMVADCLGVNVAVAVAAAATVGVAAAGAVAGLFGVASVAAAVTEADAAEDVGVKWEFGIGAAVGAHFGLTAGVVVKAAAAILGKPGYEGAIFSIASVAVVLWVVS